MTGSHFRDYHLLLDEQGEQIFNMTDDIAERTRKLGRTTLRSISDIASNQRLKDNNDVGVAPGDMILELAADNQRLIEFMRQSHDLCAQHNDVATTIRELLTTTALVSPDPAGPLSMDRADLRK